MLKSDEQDSNFSRNGFDYLKATLSASLSSESRSRIDTIVQEVSALKDIEKLLFCLLLPIDSHSGSVLGIPSDDNDISSQSFEFSSLGLGLFSSGGPSALHLSNQVEQSQAYTWILSHLEEDSTTCLRKDEVYDDYRAYCDKHHMKILNTADFGKVMKRAFPNVKPRRLGQRGQSRYCYGGMRKKIELQPPFLPDLTEEVMGVTTLHGSVGHSTTSPASSSGASGEPRCGRSVSPLTRLSRANGVEMDADEAAVRTMIGARGPVISDIAQILLEYAQQVLGVRYQSLFHLAHHLIGNRYVNSRSRHAFSLIAYAAQMPPASSPPPSAALAEAIQRGISKSAFDRIGNGKLKIGSTERSAFVKTEAEARPTREGTSPLRITTTPTTLQSSNRLNLSNQLCPNDSDRSAVYPPVSTTSVSRLHLPSCSTPQPSNYNRSYHANFSPQIPSSMTGSNVYAAAAALASQASQMNSPSLFQPVQVDSSTPSLRHSNAVALAAVAAAASAARQQFVAAGSGFSSTASPYLSATRTTNHSPVRSPFEQQQQHTPPVAHTEKNNSNFLRCAPVSIPSESSCSRVPNYLSPIGVNPSYAAHQQTSPYLGVPQPPAPLPPGAGVRSPYTQMANPPTGVSDQNLTSYKRTAPHPGDAPGAYEPSPRFHLGGQSPGKRARYMSATSGSSGPNSLSTDPSCLNSSIATEEGFGPMGSTHASSSPASSGGGSGNLRPISTFPRTELGDLQPPGSVCASPYYPGRYEGLEMRSPAPHRNMGNASCDVDRMNRLPTLTPASRDPNLWGSPMNGQNNSSHETRVFSSTANMSLSSSNVVFRPPVTPFTLELEDDDDLTNLPRLGPSPGPQIPPSSPTEFLPFYSEAASKSAARQTCHTRSDSSEERGSSLCESPGWSAATDRNSFPTSDSANLETPPSSALMPSARLGPSDGEGLSPNTPDTPDNSHDRTLTNLDSFNRVDTPPMPIVSSTADPLVHEREQLQHELSTPGPTESMTKAESPTAHSKSTDVSITAF